MFILVIILIIFIFLSLSGASVQKGKDVKTSFLNKLKENNINISQELFLSEKLYQMLVIDDVNKKLVYISRIKKDSGVIQLQSYDYTDVLKCDLVHITRNETIDSLGSIRDRRVTKEYITKQGFRITLNDLSNPTIEMIYIDDHRGSTIHYLTAVQEWIARINIIIKQGNEKAN